MKEIPMLLSGPMVRAFIEGRKTQTRRLTNRFNAKPGDRIWFKETFGVHRFAESLTNDLKNTGKAWIHYWADDDVDHPVYKWKPSIFMPKSICRCWAEVVEVRGEPLQNITYADARSEGVDIGLSIWGYVDLWDSLHKKPGTRWADNPTVFVFTFRRLTEQQVRFQKFR